MRARSPSLWMANALYTSPLLFPFLFLLCLSFFRFLLSWQSLFLRSHSLWCFIAFVRQGFVAHGNCRYNRPSESGVPYSFWKITSLSQRFNMQPQTHQRLPIQLLDLQVIDQAQKLLDLGGIEELSHTERCR